MASLDSPGFRAWRCPFGALQDVPARWSSGVTPSRCAAEGVSERGVRVAIEARPVPDGRSRVPVGLTRRAPTWTLVAQRRAGTTAAARAGGAPRSTPDPPGARRPPWGSTPPDRSDAKGASRRRDSFACAQRAACSFACGHATCHFPFFGHSTKISCPLIFSLVDKLAELLSRDTKLVGNRPDLLVRQLMARRIGSKPTISYWNLSSYRTMKTAI